MCSAFPHQFVYRFGAVYVIPHVVNSPKLNTNFTSIKPASFKLVRFLLNICIILIQSKIISQELKKKCIQYTTVTKPTQTFLSRKHM